MAAVFPLDTSKPWVFNGVTYNYDAVEDRWFVVSTTATDQVVANLDSLERSIDVTNTVIDQEIENRTVLLNQAASKNNAQDAAIDELSGRIDAIGANVGILEFKGRYQYQLERSEAACDAAYIACLNQAPGDPANASECNRLWEQCKNEVGDPLPAGHFTSIGTLEQNLTEELLISNQTLDGTSFDWENLLETGDYLELVESTQNDTVLYEVVADPVRSGTEERIRVKYIKETGAGDGNFNLQEVSEIRVIKQKLGLDIVEADKRYVQRPYRVIFSSIAPEDGEGQGEDGVLRNGELWYDTQNLELFVWNNNAWVTATKPPSQDIVISSALDDISRISGEVHQVSQELNTIDAYLQTRKNIYYSDGTPDAGSNPDGTPRSFNNGDLWIDSDDLQIKFYSQGAWINPDRTSDTNYLPLTGGTVNGKVNIYGVGDTYSLYVKQSEDRANNKSILSVYNNSGAEKFYVTGSGSVAASDGFTPSLNRHLTTKKYVDAMVGGPTRCTWIHSNQTEPSRVSSKQFYVKSATDSQSFLYLSDQTANGIRFEASTSTWGEDAHTWASHTGDSGKGQMAWWMLNDDGTWSYMANSTAYRYRFNFRGWIQIEYKNYNGTHPTSSTHGKTWGISIPELF